MATTPTVIPGVPQITVTRATLDETPARALKLLHGIGVSIPIHGTMTLVGYSDEDHREGWALLQGASNFNPVQPPDLLTRFRSNEEA